MFAFVDIETTGLDPRFNDITLFGAKMNGRYLILEYPTAETLVAWFNHCRENGIQIVEHNGDRFDTPFLKAKGVHNAYVTWDSMTMAYLRGALFNTDLGGLAALSLKELAKEEFGEWAIDASGGIGVTDEDKAYLKTDLDATEYVFNKYSLNDHEIKLHNYLQKLRVMYHSFKEKGLYIDEKRLVELADQAYLDMQQKEIDLRRKFKNSTVDIFTTENIDKLNPNSSAQLAQVFFRDMGLPVIQKSPLTGEPSVNTYVLRKLAVDHPVARDLLDYRDKKKMFEMLNKTFKEAVINGKVHSTISVLTTKTGRTSSFAPNVQQIKRGEMRDILIPPPGYVLVEFDYAQAELRVAADLSQDPVMMDIFLNGRDPHSELAALMTAKAAEDVTKQERTEAKAGNFGLLYGMSAAGFKNYAFTVYGLELSMEEAIKMRELYHNSYKRLEAYYGMVHKMAVANDGILYNGIGRPYYVQELGPTFDGKLGITGIQKNACINYPVQSFANDLLLMSCLEVNETPGVDFDVRATIHDSMIGYMRNDIFLLDNIKKVIAIMENPKMLKDVFGVTLDVPLVADCKVGPSWYKAKDLDKYLEEVGYAKS